MVIKFTYHLFIPTNAGASECASPPLRERRFQNRRNQRPTESKKNYHRSRLWLGTADFGEEGGFVAVAHGDVDFGGDDKAVALNLRDMVHVGDVAAVNLQEIGRQPLFYGGKGAEGNQRSLRIAHINLEILAVTFYILYVGEFNTHISIIYLYKNGLILR